MELTEDLVDNGGEIDIRWQIDFVRDPLGERRREPPAHTLTSLLDTKGLYCPSCTRLHRCGMHERFKRSGIEQRKETGGLFRRYAE